MNSFESLCRLASAEKWCWKLCCTTCGHMHFKYSFLELAAGKSPEDRNWFIHSRRTHYSQLLGPYPRTFTEAQKEAILRLAAGADLASIAGACSFPAWLGYLGVVLEDSRANTETYKTLSRDWAAQLRKLIPADAPVSASLQDCLEGRRLLSIADLEHCETALLERSRWR